MKRHHQAEVLVASKSTTSQHAPCGQRRGPAAPVRLAFTARDVRPHGSDDMLPCSSRPVNALRPPARAPTRCCGIKQQDFPASCGSSPQEPGPEAPEDPPRDALWRGAGGRQGDHALNRPRRSSGPRMGNTARREATAGGNKSTATPPAFSRARACSAHASSAPSVGASHRSTGDQSPALHAPSPAGWKGRDYKTRSARNSPCGSARSESPTRTSTPAAMCQVGPAAARRPPRRDPPCPALTMPSTRGSQGGKSQILLSARKNKARCPVGGGPLTGGGQQQPASPACGIQDGVRYP